MEQGSYAPGRDYNTPINHWHNTNLQKEKNKMEPSINIVAWQMSHERRKQKEIQMTVNKDPLQWRVSKLTRHLILIWNTQNYTAPLSAVVQTKMSFFDQNLIWWVKTLKHFKPFKYIHRKKLGKGKNSSSSFRLSWCVFITEGFFYFGRRFI